MKTQVEDCLALDVNILNRKGALRAGCMGTISWSGGSEIGIFAYEREPDFELVLRLSYSGRYGPVSQIIPIIWTVPNYGGKRPWFRCDHQGYGVGCGRRVGKLYLPPGAMYFACRHCYDLTYQSRQEWTNPTTKALIKTLNLMQELDRLGRKGRRSRHFTERFMRKYAQIWEQSRKAGIPIDPFPKKKKGR